MSIFSKLFPRARSLATVSFLNRGEQFILVKGRAQYVGECAWAGHHNSQLVLFASTIRLSGNDQPMDKAQQDAIASEARQTILDKGHNYSVVVAQQ